MKRTVKFKNEDVELLGELVKVGEPAKNFTVINSNLENIELKDFLGKNIVIAVFPSIDTSVCALQTTKFNQEVAKFPKDKVQLLTISVDLPFALSRFCSDKGIENALTASDHKLLDFGNKYGYILDGYRLLARGVIIIDKLGIIRHIEYVENVHTEPDYESTLNILNTLI